MILSFPATLCSLRLSSGLFVCSTLPPKSPNIDTPLTLSILRNSFPFMHLHMHLLKHFDTLSVYRGCRCEQVGRASTTRLSNCNDSLDMKIELPINSGLAL